MSDGTPFLKLEQQMGEGKGIKTRESGLDLAVVNLFCLAVGMHT